jgi:hypothetical protein
MADIQKAFPEIYQVLGTAGMRSVRLQRGKNPKKKISNHAWGVAIDLKIDKLLDLYKDDRCQHGLTKIARIFNKHRWFWGGAYKPEMDKEGRLHSKEDAMHFEVSREMLLDWAQLGYLGPGFLRAVHQKPPFGSTKHNQGPVINRAFNPHKLKPMPPGHIDEPQPNWFPRKENYLSEARTGWTSTWFRQHKF